MLGFESSIISINLLKNNVNEFKKKKFHNFVIVKKNTHRIILSYFINEPAVHLGFWLKGQYNKIFPLFLMILIHLDPFIDMLCICQDAILS